jgi:drug/metabolite transporter (DMT)-like permease
MSTPSSHRKPIDSFGTGMMLAVCLTLSLQQIAMKLTIADVSPTLQIALRSLVAGIVLLVLVLRREGPNAFLDGTLAPGLAAGVLYGLEFLLVALALHYTTAGHVIVFLYTSPIFTALGLHFKLAEERMNVRQWLGVGLAFVGIALAFLSKHDNAHVSAANMLVGDLMSMAGGAVWGLTTVLVRCSSLSNAWPHKMLFYQLLMATVMLLAAYWIGSEPAPVWSPAAWLGLGYQIVFVCLWGFLMWFWLLRRYLATQLSVMSFLTPIFGVIFGALILDEPLETGFVAGSLLALAGIVLVVRGKRAPARARAAAWVSSTPKR